MKLLLTHGEESNARIEEGLSSHGIDCVTFDADGRVYALDGDDVPDADVGLVYPSRLVEGGVVDALSDIVWVNDATDVLTTRNKARTLALLGREGIPVPETRLLSNPVSDEDVREAFDAVGTPAVVKPNSASSGRGAVLVHDADTATGVADLFGVVHESSLVRDRTFVVQEYVEDARDYRVMVLGGDYVGAVERRAPGWKKNVSAGATARATKPPDSVVSVAEETARALGVGFCGIDVLSQYGKGFVVVNEVNARPTVDDADKYEPDFYAKFARLVRNAE
ncbi:MAG: ATP-grasp domain-containing protein [Halobacteriales archaeon]|nr:ATP-grasp domain-containing protein [Halobacteriales archaeon]